MTKPYFRLSRRAVIGASAAFASSALARASWQPLFSPAYGEDSEAAKWRSVSAVPACPPAALDPALLGRALAALGRHGSDIKHRDRIAIVDFTAPSSEARLHLLDIGDGRATRFLVAHGSGSDPDHTGFVQRFSNAIDSNASSEGAFVTADYYVGKHGRSQRLLGLDRTNCNALTRAIVLHGAWYANRDMIPAHGKLGRSQGCFAVGEHELSEVLERLGEGRMIYAAKA